MEINEEQMRQMLGQLARQMGLLYLSIGKEIVEKYGQEGREIFLQGIKAFGRARGKGIAEKVKAAGEPLTLENFFKFYDVPVTVVTKQSPFEITKDGRFRKRITSCPLVDLFREKNQLELGKLYCEQDFAMMEAYNPELRFEKGSSLMEGDECCEFTYFVPGQT